MEQRNVVSLNTFHGNEQQVRLNDACKMKTLYFLMRISIFLHDNACYRFTNTILKIIISVVWEVLPHAGFTPLQSSFGFVFIPYSILIESVFPTITRYQRSLEDFFKSKIKINL